MCLTVLFGNILIFNIQFHFTYCNSWNKIGKRSLAVLELFTILVLIFLILHRKCVTHSQKVSRSNPGKD